MKTSFGLSITEPTIFNKKQEKAKLAGIVSINTSVIENEFCQKMQNFDQKKYDDFGELLKTICTGCYTIPMEKTFKKLAANNKVNLQMLSSRYLTEEEIQETCLIIFSISIKQKAILKIQDNNFYFRPHSVGEFSNLIHIVNMLRIIKKLHELFDYRTGLWTKRESLIYAAFRKLDITERPSYLNLIKSSTFANKEDKLPRLFNKVFTGFKTSFVKKHKLQAMINCDRACITCPISCYRDTRDTTYIRELMH